MNFGLLGGSTSGLMFLSVIDSITGGELLERPPQGANLQGIDLVQLPRLVQLIFMRL